MSFSYSQISTFQRCRYSWELGYKEGLMPRVDMPAPQLGTAIHKGMEAGLIGGSVFRGVDAWGKMILAKLQPDQEQVVIDQMVEAKSIATRMLDDFYERGFEVVEHKGQKLVEAELRLKLAPMEEDFVGLVDVVAREKRTGHIWCVDFKSRKSFLPEDAEEYSLQMATYQYLLRAVLGLDTKGTIAWQTRNTMPKLPKLNKNGQSMSRAILATTWVVYRAHLVANGLDPAEYEDMKGKLESIDWIRLSRAFRGKAEIFAIWDQIILPLVEDIARARKETHLQPRTLNSFNCKGCRFRDLCMEGLRGGDVQFLRETRYMKKGEIASPMDMIPDFEDDMDVDELAKML